MEEFKGVTSADNKPALSIATNPAAIGGVSAPYTATIRSQRRDARHTENSEACVGKPLPGYAKAVRGSGMWSGVNPQVSAAERRGTMHRTHGSPARRLPSTVKKFANAILEPAAALFVKIR